MRFFWYFLTAFFLVTGIGGLVGVVENGPTLRDVLTIMACFGASALSFLRVWRAGKK